MDYRYSADSNATMKREKFFISFKRVKSDDMNRKKSCHDYRNREELKTTCLWWWNWILIISIWSSSSYPIHFKECSSHFLLNRALLVVVKALESNAFLSLNTCSQVKDQIIRLLYEHTTHHRRTQRQSNCSQTSHNLRLQWIEKSLRKIASRLFVEEKRNSCPHRLRIRMHFNVIN